MRFFFTILLAASVALASAEPAVVAGTNNLVDEQLAARKLATCDNDNPCRPPRPPPTEQRKLRVLSDDGDGRPPPYRPTHEVAPRIPDNNDVAFPQSPTQPPALEWLPSRTPRPPFRRV
jgi:hypothetical protein